MNFESSVLQVAIEDIIPNRFQPRLAFEDASLTELAASIKQHGIIQPLVLRKTGDKYEIIAGERRYKAAMMAGLTYVPAVISDIDDQKSAEVAVVENVQRRELTAIEEAKSYKALLDLGYMSQEQLAKKMGISQSAIANKLRLLNLAPEVQKAVLENKISERHARSLLVVKEPEKQVEWLNKIIEERLTVRALDALLNKEYKGGDMNNENNIESQKANATDINVNPSYTTTPAMPSDAIDLGEKPNSRFFNNNLEEQAVNMQMTAAINPLAQQMNQAPAPEPTPTPEPVQSPDMSMTSPMPEGPMAPISNDNMTISMAPEAPMSDGYMASPMPQTEPMPFDSSATSIPMAGPDAINDNIKNASMPGGDVELLDVIEPSQPNPVKNINEAKNRIINIVNELKNESYNVELMETSNGGNIVLTITIKNEDIVP